jgi:hypothetical protein
VRGRADLFRESCRIAVEAGSFKFAWIGAIDAVTGEGRVAASFGGEAAYLGGIRLGLRVDAPHNGLPSNRALRNLQPVICNDVAADASLAPLRADLLARGLRSHF